MKQIELTDSESVLLTEVLESYISDLKTERVHTDKREWRQDFKEREGQLIDLLNRIKG